MTPTKALFSSALLLSDSDAVYQQLRQKIEALGDASPILLRRSPEPLQDAICVIREHDVDIIFFHGPIREVHSRKIVLELSRSCPATPLECLIQQNDEDFAVELLESGISGYLVLEALDAGSLRKEVRRSFARNAFRREGTRQRDEYSNRAHWFAKVLDSSVDGLMVLGESGKVLFANRSAGIMLNRSIPSLLKSEFPRLTSQGSTTQISVQHADEDEKLIEIRSTGSLDGSGEMRVACLRDVTKQTRVDEALRIATQQIRTVMAGAPVILWAMDAEGIFTFCEGNPLDLLGLKPSELLGHSAFDLFPDVGGLADFLRRALSGERFFERLTVRAIVHQVWFEPMMNEHGTVIGVMGVSTDITSHARVEAELRRSNAELTEFADFASHDLKEPLRTVDWYAQFLIEDEAKNLSPEGRGQLEKISAAVRRMNAYVDGLLALCRLDRSPERYETIDLTALVTDTLEDLKRVIADSGTVVRVESLPTLKVDPAQMRELFQNLVLNAVKFCRNGVAPEIRVYAEDRFSDLANLQEAPHLRWRIIVEDNGRGIAPEHISRVFVLFHRVAEAKNEGFGIGLALCRKIVEVHGGDINVESEVGKGSRFITRLAEYQEREEVTSSEDDLVCISQAV